MLELMGTGLALPAGHARHDETLDAPSIGLYVPAGHASKVMLALAAPTDAQKPPTGQSVQLVALKPSLNLPATHARQAAWPSRGWKAPGEHGMHDSLVAAPMTGM